MAKAGKCFGHRQPDWLSIVSSTHLKGVGLRATVLRHHLSRAGQQSPAQ
jgi:hypothetical protein